MSSEGMAIQTHTHTHIHTHCLVLHTLCEHSFVLVYLRNKNSLNHCHFHWRLFLGRISSQSFLLIFSSILRQITTYQNAYFLRKLRISNSWEHCVDVCKSTQCFKFLHCVDIFCSQVHTSYVTQNHPHPHKLVNTGKQGPPIVPLLFIFATPLICFVHVWQTGAFFQLGTLLFLLL